MGIRETKKDNSELFKWDGKPSAGQVFPLAAQHVLAAVVGCVTPAILVANAANNAGGNVDMGLLIQMSLVFAALSTLLQLYGNKIRIGSGLPVIIGVSFAYVPTMTAIAAQAKSIDTILGAMLIGGVIAIIVGLTIKQIRKVFPPLVIGTVIFAIGLSLYKTAINYMAGNPANTYELVVEQQGKTPALVFGSWQNWVVAFVTLAIVVALNHYGKGLFKLASILIGLLCGYVLALCFGMVDFSVLSSAGWFQIPKPMEFGMKFEISAIIPLAILFLVNSIQAMGDFSATTSGGMDRLPTDRELNGGIIGYGIGNIISAFFGCPPTATFSQNVGIVGTTKVISRRVFATSAGILLVAGLIPKFSALLRTIPQCVLGGAVVSVFASIAMTGIRLLVTEKLTARNATVAGLSIAIGMGVSLSGGCLDQMTQSIHSALNLSMNLENFQAIINNTFASSPVVLATIFAVILNLILPKEKTTEKETIDVRGKLLFPGFIDAHTHMAAKFNDITAADKFETGTKAALAGGTTCIIDFAEQKKGKSLKEAIDDKRQEAEGEASCDYALHLTLNEWNDDVAEELGEIVKKETCSFKLYTAYDMMLDDGQIYEIFSRVKELGGIVGVHCENHGIVQSRLKELEKTKGRTDIADYSWIHPKEAEAEAVGRILKIAKCADVPVIIVNLSTAAGYREILKAREIGQTVYVETCPEYLLLNEEKYALAAEEARKYVTVPPLRKQKNSDILWDALKEGRIQTIASDHFGFTKEQKNAGEEDFMLTPSGMPGAEERPALMWQFGVNEGKITAEQMCAYLSENPAKLFKLYPWKGALIPGSDADIVIWNPNTEWTMTAADHQSACDYCLLEGAEIEGRAEQVYLRGKLVAENGKIIEEKTGMYIRHGVE